MQTPQNMDALIAHELEEGERVLWTGRPDPNNKSSASPMMPFYIMTAVFGLVGILLILIGFIVSTSVHGKSGSDALLGLSIPGVVFIFMALVFGIISLVYRPNLKGTVYAITEQRIISVNSGNKLTVYSYGKNDIGVLNRIEQPDGTGDLIFAINRQTGGYNGNYSSYGAGYGTYGGSAGANMGNISIAANAGKFLGIPNVREVERIVRRTFK